MTSGKRGDTIEKTKGDGDDLPLRRKRRQGGQKDADSIGSRGTGQPLSGAFCDISGTKLYGQTGGFLLYQTGDIPGDGDQGKLRCDSGG